MKKRGEPNRTEPTLLILGASGFIGEAIVPPLLKRGLKFKLSCRKHQNLLHRFPTIPKNGLFSLDLFDTHSFAKALDGIETVLFLASDPVLPKPIVNSQLKFGFLNFARACSKAGVKKVVHLFSPQLHLNNRSPQFLSNFLSKRGISYQLVESLPVFYEGSQVWDLVQTVPFPYWDSQNQTYSFHFTQLSTLVEELSLILETQPVISRIYPKYKIPMAQIKGPRWKAFLKEMGLFRSQNQLPFPPPLSRYAPLMWVPTPLGAKLSESIFKSLYHGQNWQPKKWEGEDFPEKPLDLCDFFRLKEKPFWGGTRFTEREKGGNQPPDRIVCKIRMDSSEDEVWRGIMTLGGGNGWFFGHFFWKLLGLWDKILGGVGMFRGRRRTSPPFPGDVLDGFRVVSLNRGKSFHLECELALFPGSLLNWSIKQTKIDKGLELIQTFNPGGMSPLLWELSRPLLKRVLMGLIHSLARQVRKYKFYKNYLKVS